MSSHVNSGPSAAEGVRYGQLANIGTRTLYLAVLFGATSLWFLAYRTPLWLDETVSYWEISGGFTRIWSRTVQGLSFPPYFYLLWLTERLFGNREVVLRAPSVIAMLAAVAVLFRIAREFFDEDASFIVCILFCLQHDVAFAAIDVRPYSFAVLSVMLSIYALIRWLKQPDRTHSIALGLSCAVIFYFHYLYGVVLPAFLVCYLLARQPAKLFSRQVGILICAFTLAFLPVVPRLSYILSRRNSYSFTAPPTFMDFLSALVPGALRLSPLVFLGLLVILFLSLVFRQFRGSAMEFRQAASSVVPLALVPAGLLFAISIATPLRVFVERYRLVGTIGIALAWGSLFSLIRWRGLRLFVSVSVCVLAVYSNYHSPAFRTHGYSWKGALEYAQFIAEGDDAPLVVFSDLPQADFEPMPIGTASDSVLFAQLSYYQVTVPVIPAPRALSEESKRIGTETLANSLQNHQRFLVLAYAPSYPAVQWIMGQARYSHVVQLLGNFDGVAVVEFRPL